MAVVAFIERLDQMKACRRQRCGDLCVRDAVPADDVDRAPEQMIAIRNAAYSAIMFDGPKRARHDTERRGDPHYRSGLDRSRNGLCAGMRRLRPYG